jgi:hypothetical protein
MDILLKFGQYTNTVTRKVLFGHNVLNRQKYRMKWYVALSVQFIFVKLQHKFRTVRSAYASKTFHSNIVQVRRV